MSKSEGLQLHDKELGSFNGKRLDINTALIKYCKFSPSLTPVLREPAASAAALVSCSILWFKGCSLFESSKYDYELNHIAYRKYK